MQIRCTHCNRPYALKREEVYAALDTLHTQSLKHFNSHCPHCGKTNRLSRKQMRRSAPGWRPPEARQADAE